MKKSFLAAVATFIDTYKKSFWEPIWLKIFFLQKNENFSKNCSFESVLGFFFWRFFAIFWKIAKFWKNFEKNSIYLFSKKFWPKICKKMKNTKSIGIGSIFCDFFRFFGKKCQRKATRKSSKMKKWHFPENCKKNDKVFAVLAERFTSKSNQVKLFCSIPNYGSPWSSIFVFFAKISKKKKMAKKKKILGQLLCTPPHRLEAIIL